MKMNPEPENPRATGRISFPSVSLIAALFAVAAVGIFFLFFIQHPVDWLQAETLRLRYYGLQAGLEAGPLSASLNRYDLLKPLVWEAQGGAYDARYLIMLFDALIPKLYQPFYSWWGPSLREPVNLILMALTWIFTVLLIREWFKSVRAGLVAASFWLLTSQSLLDAHFPIRPNMALLTFLLVYIIWEVIRLRRLERARCVWFRLGAALLFALSAHEFSFNFVPLLALLFILEWKNLRRWLFPALVTCLAVWAVYLLALFVVLPPLVTSTVGRSPPAHWVSGTGEPLLPSLSLILLRFRDSVLVGIREMIHQNLGAGVFLPAYLRPLGPLAALAALAAGGLNSLRAALKPLIPAVLYFIAIALFAFPTIPSTVAMPVYYYATIIILFVIALGAFLSRAFSRSPSRWLIPVGSLLLIGGLNYAQSSKVLGRMPSDFGFNDLSRIYTRDVLSLPPVRRGEKVFPAPVYTAYPRPRVFDISRRWDIMLRVWHGESEQVFSMMLPVLNLRLYEHGYLIGDPEEFLVHAGRDQGEYENRAEIYWDMSARRLYDLAGIRAASLRPERAPLWRPGNPNGSEPGPRSAEVGPGLLGEQPRISLPPGEWKLTLDPPVGEYDSLAVIFAVRADLFPSGPTDVFLRETPLSWRSCQIRIESPVGEEIFAGHQNFGWSWQLFQTAFPASENGWTLAVESQADFEVIGPVFVSASEEDPVWSCEFDGEFRF